jgi:hypothetical protein
MCGDCPLNDVTSVTCNIRRCIGDELSKIVEIVEKWSRENPEIIGKKYIIEIDKVDRDRGRKQYHVKGAQGFWISDGNITDLEEYKGHDACKACKYEDKTEKEEPCVRCRYAYRDKWEAKR